MTAKRFTKYIPDSYGYTYITTIVDNEKNKQTGNIDEIIDILNELNDENEQLKNKINVLEDDNETYHKIENKKLHFGIMVNKERITFLDLVNSIGILYENKKPKKEKY